LSSSSRFQPCTPGSWLSSGPPEPATPEFFDYATLRRGLSFERHAIAWCDWLLDALG